MSLTEKFSVAVGVVLSYIPRVVGALIALLIGWIVAKAFQGLTLRGLRAAHLDERMRESEGGEYVTRITATPSRFLSKVVFWAFWLAAIALALSVLNIPALTAFLSAIVAYVPNVIAALLILLVAGFLSVLATNMISRLLGDTPTGKIARSAAPALIMTIGVFMALNQLKIAPDIVNITFTALVGALALGSAIAFGLGGRHVAEHMLEDAYSKGQHGVEQARQDLARQNEARSLAEQTKAEKSQAEQPQEVQAQAGTPLAEPRAQVVPETDKPEKVPLTPTDVVRGRPDPTQPQDVPLAEGDVGAKPSMTFGERVEDAQKRREQEEES
jgi:hypothetical protein